MDCENALRLAAAELYQEEKLILAMYLIREITPTFDVQITPSIAQNLTFSDNLRRAFGAANEYPPDAKILLPIAIELLLEEI
jgi:hypothetical protein